MPVVAVFHWVSFPSPTLVTLTALFLLVLPDPVSLIMAPGVVSRRSSVHEVVQCSPGVLTGPEHGEIGLERLQELVDHVTAGRGGGSAEGVVGHSLALVVTAGQRLLQQIVVVRVESSGSHCSQDGSLVVFTVRTVGGVDQQ